MAATANTSSQLPPASPLVGVRPRSPFSEGSSAEQELEPKSSSRSLADMIGWKMNSVERGCCVLFGMEASRKFTV